MIDKNTIVKVTNRDNGSVGYTIPDLGNLHRKFQAGETKEITAEELRKLSYIPGGDVILRNFLIIDNSSLVAELIGDVEPEYYYSEEDIKRLLVSGSLDEFEDCLDFAPEGTINIIKKMAVELKLNDISKRKAIYNRTGFNVDSAITIEEESKGDEEETSIKTRRAATPKVPSTENKTTRRVSKPASNYEIVSIAK